MSLKPWRAVAIPHDDVLKGTFQQAEFAADLSRVHEGKAMPEYQDPVLFYQRTFITEGMRLLLDSVVKRLIGRGGDPVIQLQTAFGGGKTHTMLAVYHLAKGDVAAADLQGISIILDAAGVQELPRAQVVVIDGTQLSPSIPKDSDGVLVRTLWGQLAVQLGGRDAYERVRDADLTGTSPGKDVLIRLLNDYSPCVILVDELVRYVAQFEEGQRLSGGTYDSNLSFIQALTDSLKAAPKAIMLASLPESEREAGSRRGIDALATLSHYFGRVQALWKPVAAEEAFEIVRRRLFSAVRDQSAAEATCRAFADYYVAQSGDFPHETQDSRYHDRLLRAYPIHPEVFDRLYTDWSSLDNFQRTRGVLKLMAKVIHRLWKDGNDDLLITPGSIPLYDADTRNEVIYYLPQGWDPVVERDIDGERAEATDIDSRDTRLGAVQACRRAARTIFLGSAPGVGNRVARGLEAQRVVLGCAQPGQSTSIYTDGIRKLSDRLHYLGQGNNRFWFDTRPNLRREMEERKRRFDDRRDVVPAIQSRIESEIKHGQFGGVHVFRQSGDVQDDWALRLVVLPPDEAFSRAVPDAAVKSAEDMLTRHGEQPRLRQNRLVFLAADRDSVSRLKDQVRSLLAWQSIVSDTREAKLNLNVFETQQANKAQADADAQLRRMIREAYRWLLVPTQEAKPGRGVSKTEWESFQLNSSAKDFTGEIERVLRENEALITEWAPVHLANMLRDWFWKDGPDAEAVDAWQKTCCYLYLPRLTDERVFRAAIQAGVSTEDFFGLAYGKEEDRYLGFTFDKQVTPAWDSTLLLIAPAVALAYAAKMEEEKRKREAEAHEGPVGGAAGGAVGLQSSGSDGGTAGSIGGGVAGKADAFAGGQVPRKRRFFGTISLDAITAKQQFGQFVDEILLHFTTLPGVKVQISIDISAQSPGGFDERVQRIVGENSRALGFRNAEFEEDE